MIVKACLKSKHEYWFAPSFTPIDTFAKKKHSSYWGKGKETVSYLFVLVEVAGRPVILAGFPVTAYNIAYNVLVEHNNL